MAKRLRIPKGVVVGGKAYGGRFASPEDVARLARHATPDEVASVRRLIRLAERELRRAVKTHERAAERFLRDETDAARRRRLDAATEQERWAGVVNRSYGITSGPGAMLVRVPDFEGRPYDVAEVWGRQNNIDIRRIDEVDDDEAPETIIRQVPRPKTMMRRGPTSAVTVWVVVASLDESLAAEWEIAVEYGAGDSPVDINIRITRDDGRPFDQAEATRVFDAIKSSGGDAPPGYLVAGVDWRNPRKSSTFKESSNPESDLGALWAPVFASETYEIKQYRFGAVDT